MHFPPQVTIKGKTYGHVDTQRDGVSAIYKDETTYVRIGQPDKIRKDLELHKKMEQFNFPVAKLLGEGEMEGMTYFIEESLGDKCYGLIFQNETEKFGQIQDQTFDQFLAICLKFATAQLKTVTKDQPWEKFAVGVHLPEICQELPEEAGRIKQRWAQAIEHLKVFPFAICHGDFGSFNTYPKGVIDLESSFLGPIGYDVGAWAGHAQWFPESSDYEFYRLFNFTKAQKDRYFSTLDELYQQHELPRISDYIADWDFTKGIWSSARNHKAPKLQQYRYELFKKLL